MSQLQEAVKAIKAGDKKTGQRLLQQLVETDPANETAWMWLAVAVEEPRRKKQYLQRVLEINPANTTARQALSQLEINETREELPGLDEIVPNSSSPQTDFITRTELAKNTSKAAAMVSLVLPLAFGIMLLLFKPEYMGIMVFPCSSRGVSAEACSQPLGWIMTGILIISAIITYFSVEKTFTMQQAKNWGGCIIFLVISVIFSIISVFLTFMGPAVLIVIEAFL